MRWQEDFARIYHENNYDYRLHGSLIIWCKFAVSPHVAEQLKPFVESVNAGRVAGIKRGFARLFAVREPGHSSAEAMAEFIVRLVRPWNTIELANFPGYSHDRGEIVDSEKLGTPIFASVDFDQVVDGTWRDRPPLL